MHGVKSITQRTRECMRNQRSERRVNEVFQIIQDDEDEVPPSDISITLDEAMGDPDVTEFECSMQSSVSDFSNDSSSNSSEHGSCDEGTLDTGSLYDEINDRMLCYDLNNQTKPYPSCPLSIRDACLAIVKVARRLNLDKNGTKHLLDCIRSLSPIDAKLPRTISALMEVIGEYRFMLLETDRVVGELKDQAEICRDHCNLL